MTLPANKIENVRRRVARARKFPSNTCGASRHVHHMADIAYYVSKSQDHVIFEEPEDCAAALYSVLESLWKCRTELAKLKAKR